MAKKTLVRTVAALGAIGIVLAALLPALSALPF